MDPMTLSMLIGGGTGGLKYVDDMLNYDAKKHLASQTQRYSPWTGLKAEAPDHPSLLGDLMGGVSSGMGVQNSLNQYSQGNQLFDLAKTGLGTENELAQARLDRLKSTGSDPFTGSINVGAGAGSSWVSNPLGMSKTSDGGFDLGPAPTNPLAGGASAMSRAPASAAAGLQAPGMNTGAWPVIGVTDSGAAVGGTPAQRSGVSSNADQGLRAGTTASGQPPSGVNYSRTGMSGSDYRVESPSQSTGHPLDPNSPYVWDPVTNTYRLKSQQ